MINNNTKLRSALLASAASMLAVGLSTASVYAADAPQQVETVVVTGSRIPTEGITSASPMTAVSNQELKFQGTTNIENLINSLPAAVAGYTQATSNGSTGTASVDLRGLGASRTLVLIDGKRIVPGDPAYPVTDINIIPAAMVERVEVLTGGASAVYGSDAESGVVNFILRKDFEGVEASAQYSINQAGNGKNYFESLQNKAGFKTAPHDWWGGATGDISVIFGTNSSNGKGNITGFFTWRNTAKVTQDKRDFSACALSTTKTKGVAVNPSNLYCAGSSNYNRWISMDDYYAGANYDFFETGTGKAGSGTFSPYTGAANQTYNFGATNYIQRPDTRFTGGFNAHYQAQPWLDLYSSFLFMDDHTKAQIAPSGLFLGTGNVAGTYLEVNCDNPLMTAQENASLCGVAGTDTYTTGAAAGRYNGSGNKTAGQALLEIGRRGIESGGRLDDLRHDAFRLVIGGRGDINSAWSYDVSGQYGVTLYSETYQNDFSVSKVAKALQVNPTTGHCYAFDNGTDTKCVPLDIFNGLGSISKEALKYVVGQGFKQGNTTEAVVSASFTGDLGAYGVKSPFASAPVRVAFGTEYRRETLELKTSSEFQNNDLFGQGGATLPVSPSGFSVIEGYGEVRIPLVQNKKFIEDLTFDGAARYSSYSTAGGVWAYKGDLQWQIIDDLRLRGSYQRAVKAPSVLDLYSPSNVVLFSGQDPCGSSATGKVLANCIAMGVGNAGSGLLNCPSSQCDYESGGSTALKPEESDTFAVGAVFTPNALPGFTLTVDYYNIHIKDAIATVAPTAILAACYGGSANATSQAFACPLVHRNATGAIYGQSGYVVSDTVNTGGVGTSGIDIEANYQFGLEDIGLPDLGSMALNMVATYVGAYKDKPYDGSSTYDCAGHYGVTCGSPYFTWSHKARATWETPWNVTVSLDWRHKSSASLDLATNDPLMSGAYNLHDLHLPSMDYFDLSTSWNITEGFNLSAGVSNLFDRDPPVVDTNNYAISGPPFGNGNTFPGVYDAMGRTMFVRLTIKQ